MITVFELVLALFVPRQVKPASREENRARGKESRAARANVPLLAL